MSLHSRLKPNTYIDSVTLMAVSTAANKLPGVRQAQVAMGSAMNKAVLAELHLLDDTLQTAGNADLMLVVQLEDGADADAAFAGIEALLARKPAQEEGGGKTVYHTLAAAADNVPDSNLALISVNGAYA